MVCDPAFFAEVKQRHLAHEIGRREVIKLAADAQHFSKRAIFALHRDDTKEADRLLSDATTQLSKIRDMVAEQARLNEEGSFRAALEEFAEAALYRAFVQNGKVGRLEMDWIDQDIYLGGLADLTGELQRRQVRKATERKLDEVKELKNAIEEIVTVLLEMDLGGYLRTKFDQSKNSLRRAEEVLYETTLRS
jgi:predicted translin family RNA/ssDNA-binding protein